MSFNAGEIKKQRFQILASGHLDNGRFNKWILEIRKTLKLPKGGLSHASEEEISEWHDNWTKSHDAAAEDPAWLKRLRELDDKSDDYEKKHRELHKELPVNFLTYSIEEILEEYPDLGEDAHNTLREYIISGSIPIRSGITVSHMFHPGSMNVNKGECIVKITEKLTLDDMKVMMKIANKLLEHKPDRPLKNLKKDLKIAKLSRKKGSKIKSNLPEQEFEGEFSDESIAVKALKRSLVDEPGRVKKNNALIRSRRKRLKDRFKESFPLYFNKNKRDAR